MSTSPAHHLFQEDIYRFHTGILLILPRPWHKILDEEKALVAKILSSVRISIESVTIQDQPNVVLGDLSLFRPEKVLIFGCAVSPEIPLYEKQSVDGVVVVRADDPGQLDDTKKKSLWRVLKEVFPL